MDEEVKVPAEGTEETVDTGADMAADATDVAAEEETAA